MQDEEKRKEERFIQPSKMYYSYSIGEENWSEDIPAFYSNKSSSGLAFYTTQFFERGHHLQVKLDSPDAFKADATVIWCDHIGNSLYKIGITLGHNDD